ncbi:MAG TPA: hypothetical protein DEA71_18360, partial [Nitrospira sp.]|nr:hypothetical protein [Nitrospira sp.]
MRAVKIYQQALSLCRAVIRRMAVGSLLLVMLITTACIGPIKPVPTAHKQEPPPQFTDTADAAKSSEPTPPQPVSAPFSEAALPLPVPGIGQPDSPAQQEELPVVESRPVQVVAQRESYSVSNSVVGMRNNVPLMHSPVSVQVVLKAVLQDQQAIRLQDALKNVSGVQPTATGGEYDNFLIRGFST